MVGATAIELDVVDRRRGAVEADIRRKGRLHARHALLALERLEHRGLFAADIGARAVMDINVARPPVDIVLADQPRLIGLVDRRLQALPLEDILAANIDVGRLRAHRERSDERTLDESVRIVPHDLAVLAGAGFGFVGVDDEVMRALGVDRLGHERPFEAGWKACAAATAQTRSLHLADDPIAPLVDQRLRIVPLPARAGALQADVAQAIEIGEDAVLVLEHRRPQTLSGAAGASSLATGAAPATPGPLRPSTP